MTGNGKSHNGEPSVWNYIISVSLSIVMIIVVVKVVVSLVPKRSVFFETEKVASETYKKFTSRLETISKESAKDIEARMKDI